MYDKYKRKLHENLEKLGTPNGFKLEPCLWVEGTTYTPVELYDIIGPSPRICFDKRYHHFKSKPGFEVDFKDLNPDNLDFSQDGFVKALVCGTEPELAQRRKFHEFFFGSNSRASNPVKHPCLVYDVPTFFLRHILVKHFCTLQLEEQRAFASLVSLHPQISWIFFEQMAIGSLVSSEIAQDFHLCCTPDKPLQLGPGLHPPSLFVPDKFNDKGPLVPTHNQIYILQKGFSSFDAFVFTSKETRSVIFLQMTTAKGNEINHQGIHAIVKLFPKSEWQLINWVFLFASPTYQARSIAEQYVNNQALKSFKVDKKKIVVKIGWMVVKSPNESVNEVMVSSLSTAKIEGQYHCARAICVIQGTVSETPQIGALRMDMGELRIMSSAYIVFPHS